MATVNIAGYSVSANPMAPNSLFACDGGGSPSPLVRFLENVTMTETADGFVFKQTTGTGEEETIGTIQKIDNSNYIGSVEMSESSTEYIFTAETVSGDREEIGRVKKEVGIDFIRPQSEGKLTQIEEQSAESYLDFTGTNGTELRLPLIYMGTFADPGNNLVQGLQTGTNHGANGEKNTYLLIRAESGLSYLYTLPDGGSIGQVLAKRSAASYDFEWSDAGNPVITLDENAVPATGNFERIAAYYGNDPVIRFITDTGDFISAGVIPPGGTTGQILRKKSADDYDTEWVNPETKIFNVEEVTDTNEANVCLCTLSSTDSSVSQKTITWENNAWMYRVSSGAYKAASTEEPLILTTQLRGLPRPAGLKQRIISTDTILASASGHSSGRRFIFDLKMFTTSMQIGTSGSFNVYNTDDGKIWLLCGTDSFLQVRGGYYAGVTWTAAAQAKTFELNDTNFFNITVENVKFYKVTEVTT